MYGLDLFSGIGGITKALEGYVRPVAYCENDRYCQAILLSRQTDGQLPVAPIWDDIRTLQGSFLPSIDIIYGGFPCQDISVAGRGAGLDGERSGLFFEIVRLVREIRPRFVFIENSPAITSRGGVRAISAFAALRYDCRWGLLSAADVGANHIRERWWCLARYSDGGRGTRLDEVGEIQEGTIADTERSSEDVAHAEHGRMEKRWGVADTAPPMRNGNGIQTDDGQSIGDAKKEMVAYPLGDRRPKARARQSLASGENVANSECDGRERCRSDGVASGSLGLCGGAGSDQIKNVCNTDRSCRPSPREAWSGWPNFGHPDWWSVEPSVGRVAHGVPKRVDRLRALGNAVVPLQAREAFERLMGLK